MAASRLSSLSALDHIRLNGCALPVRVLPNLPFLPDKPDTLLDLFLAFRSKVDDANKSTPSQGRHAHMTSAVRKALGTYPLALTIFIVRS